MFDKRLRPGLKHLILIATAILVLNFLTQGSPTLVERLLASLLIIAAYLPTYIWLEKMEEGGPFLSAFCALYAIYFALPIFILEKYSRASYINVLIDDIYIEKALLYSLLGLLFLFIGYYAVRSSRLRLRLIWEGDQILGPLGVILGVIGLGVYSANLMNLQVALKFQQAIVVLSDLSLVAMIILYTLQLNGDKLRKFQQIFLWGILVPLRILVGVATGATFQGTIVILLLVMVYGVHRRRIAWVGLVLGILLIFAVRPVQTEFRKIIWNTDTTSLSIAEKANAFIVSVGKDLESGGTLRSRVQTLASRLTHLMTFANVVELTPTSIPFWNGESYRALAHKLIPRFVYPTKPQEDIGQTFGHRYGFIASDDFSTSYNLVQLIEFYVNFGLSGVLIGMLAFGALYKLIQLFLASPNMELGNSVAAVLVSLKLLNFETNLSAVLGGIPWVLALVFLVHAFYFLAKRFLLLLHG